MSWTDLERMFNRAFCFTFSRRKLLFIAPILLSCGVLIVLSKAMAMGASGWVRTSLYFLPLFFCSILLISAGVVLVRIYHDEVKGLAVAYRETIKGSLELIVQVAYLGMPLMLSYILLWTVLGVFYLLQELPLLGKFLGVVLSFGPFLLLLGSFLLTVLAVHMLFYLTPLVALRSIAHVQILEDLFKRFMANPFTNTVLFLVALFPCGLISVLMTLAALMTEESYLSQSHFIGGMDLFFIMLPFSLLLAPAVIFFFNFATESYVGMHKRQKEKSLS